MCGTSPISVIKLESIPFNASISSFWTNRIPCIDQINANSHPATFFEYLDFMLSANSMTSSELLVATFRYVRKIFVSIYVL